MSSPELTPMWSLMAENTFVFESEEDLTCVLCHHLMVDACQSLCGCQYCYKCISAYTSNGDKCCPGNKEYCNDVTLALDKNLFRNLILNKKVSKVKVRCPNHSCGCNIELVQLHDHLRLCTKQPMECPFLVIGCTNDIGNKTTIETHIRNDVFVHNGLLVEVIQNLKNELDGLKENLQRDGLAEKERINKDLHDLRQEIDILKTDKNNLLTLVNALQKESESKEERIMGLEEQLGQVRNEMEMMANKDTKIMGDISVQRRDLTAMMKEIKGLSTLTFDLRNEVNDKFEKYNEKLNSLKDEVNNEENNIATLRAELGQVTVDVGKWVLKEKFAKEELKSEFNRIIEATILDRKILDKQRKRQMNKWIKLNKLCPNIDAVFTWKIDQCSKKVNSHNFSEPFYMNNYKFCLYIFIGNDDNVGVGFYIMRGENDGRVEWPMRDSMTLSIIDQDTLKRRRTETFRYETYEGRKVAFERPTNERGKYYIGTTTFTKYSSIKDNSSIISNDSLILCVFADP